MANKKRRCLSCKKYREAEKGITAPIGFFCDSRCRYDYATKKPKELKEKTFKIVKKKDNAKKKKFRDNDKPLRLKEAQKAFNAFIRKRDDKDPCISCGRHHQGQYHAGHYKTTKARSDIRFNEDNCHKQCSVCNNHLSGNIDEYKPNLIKKIGEERFNKLLKVNIVSYSCEDLKAIELKYKDKLKELNKVNYVK